MNEKQIPVLIIEPSPDRIEFLEEAFTEIAETHFQRGFRGQWVRSYALDVEEAASMLERQTFEVILLDMGEPGEPALARFLELRALSGSAPVVLLAKPGEEADALALVRQGAQDFLLDSEIDCSPLDRTLRCAIERSQLLQVHDSHTVTDDLTGALNERGFLSAAQRDIRIAHDQGLTPIALLAEGNLDGCDPDLAAIRIAESLWSEASPTDLVGRLNGQTFALLALARSAAEGERRLRHLAGVISPVASIHPMIGSEVGETLCENIRVDPRSRRHL